MTTETIKPAKSKKYIISYSDYDMLLMQTELEPNKRLSFRTATIDFNNCSLSSGREKTFFDCLSEDQFVHVMNGGYYEEAPPINENERI